MKATVKTDFGRWLGHRPKLCMVGILLLAWSLRLYGLTFQSFWRDEVDAVIFSSAPLKELLGYFVRPGWNGPLYYLLLRGWTELTGRGEFTVRFFSVLFGTLAVALTYRLGKRFLPEAGGILTGLLATASPYLIWYSQEAKMYGLLMSLGALVLLLHLEALEKGKLLRWLAYLWTLGLCFYVHLHSFFLFLGQVALFLGFWPRYRHRWKGELASWLAVLLPALPLLRWLLPDFLSPRPTGFPYYPLPDMLMILLGGWSTGILSSFWPWSVIPCGVALAASLIAWRRSLPLWAFGLSAILGLYIICLKKPVFTDRYLIYIAPAFYVLVAMGILRLKPPAGLKPAGGLSKTTGGHPLHPLAKRRSRLPSTARRLPLVTLLILVVDAEAIWNQTHTPIKSDFRSAVVLFREYAREGDAVVFLIPYVQRVFDYYDPPPYQPIEAPYTNYGMSEAQVDAYLRRRIGHRERVWLVLSEEAMWDSQGLVPRWFEEHYDLALAGRFTRVSILLYQKPPIRIDLEALKYRCFLPLVVKQLSPELKPGVLAP